MRTLSIGKKQRIYAIAFSPNGGQLAAACGDLLVRVWDLAKECIVHTTTVEKTPYANLGFTLTYLDDHRLLIGGANLGIWDVEKSQWTLISPDFVWGRQMRLSPDRKYYAETAKTQDVVGLGGLRLLRIDDWEQLPFRQEDGGTTGGLAFSPDSSRLATGHIRQVGYKSRSLGQFGRYDVNDYEYLIYLREMPSGGIVGSFGDWSQAVTNLAFSPNGTILAGTAGIWLRAWDLVANREVAVQKRGPKHFQGLSFNDDGRFLATVSNDKTVRIWDAVSWQEYRTYTWEIGQLLNIAFAPDGLCAAAGSDKGQIVLWDVD